MSVICAPTVSAASVTIEDRRRAEAFIAHNEGSVLAVILQRILAAAARGVDVGIVEHDAELTPNQAAELLRMSRPHLLSFMDRGDLPFRRVGTHRRIKMADLVDFMQAREAGAEILANAMHGQGAASVPAQPLSKAEMDELDSL